MTDAVLTPTPNDCDLPRRRSDFATFNEAIDYAARSDKGLNFHDMRGTLERVYPYAQMREDALEAAYRLMAMGIGKEDRVALVAETSPEFAALFCACTLMGAWPVPLRGSCLASSLLLSVEPAGSREHHTPAALAASG